MLKMKKQLGLFLALVLLVMQNIAVLHMAEHAFCKHMHHGKSCEIATYYEQGKSSDIPPPVALHTLQYAIFQPLPSIELSLHAARYTETFPRAPPLA